MLKLTLALASILAVSVCSVGQARDSGQWQDNEVSQWYKSLMQNDVPNASCCGEADSYWCDTIHVRGDKTVCVITDDRDDGLLKRRHVNIGTEIEIPPNKMNKDPNPTGHSVVFLSSNNYVYCFVYNGGV